MVIVAGEKRCYSELRRRPGSCSPSRPLRTLAGMRRALPLLFVACLPAEASEPTTAMATATTTTEVPATPVPFLEISVPMPELPIETVDPYEGARDWCYEIDDLPPCQLDVEDGEMPTKCDPDPRTGRARICVDPWWVEGHERVCVPKPLNSKERKHSREELAAIVYRRVDGKHEGLCTPQRWWRWGQGHPVDEGKCNPEPLTKLLRVVSWRESRHDARKSHLLNPDKRAALRWWEKKRDTYADVNPAYWDAHRWRGKGSFGHNVALHLWRWDAAAPPEVLCNRVVAIETYTETLRDCHARLVSLRGELPDWWDLHHCASGGSFARPEEISTDKGSFVQRASVVKLDPSQKVPRSWLGEPIEHTMAEVRDIEADVELYLSASK
jgi:hypothetical protein